MTGGAEATAGRGHVVQWLRVPAALYLESLRRLDDLVHELRIVRSGSDNPDDDRPGRGLASAGMGPLIDEILAAYPASRDEGEHQAQRAVESGEELVDITILLPAEAAHHANRLVDLLEAADELCRREQLLTLAATPDIAHLRRWARDQINRQVTGGEDPEPFALPE